MNLFLLLSLLGLCLYQTAPASAPASTPGQPSAAGASPSGGDKAPTPEDIAAMSDEDLRKVLEPKPPTTPGKAQPEAVKTETKKPEDNRDPRDKVIEDQKSMIGRQSTEVGQLRKQNDVLNDRLSKLESQIAAMSKPPATSEDPSKLAEKFFADPRNTTEEIIKDTLTKREKEQQEKTQQEEKQMKECFNAFTSELGIKSKAEGDEIIKNVFAVILQDHKIGPDDEIPEWLKDFAKNPFKAKPATLLSLARRAKAEMKIREMEASTRTPPSPKKAEPYQTVNASMGNSSTQENSLQLTPETIAAMSAEELKQLAKKTVGKSRVT